MSRLRESTRLPTLIVRARNRGGTSGRLALGQLVIPCSLGRSGRRPLKREGDGATPVGDWRLVCVLYRADRLRRPRTGLPVGVMRPDAGWCDAPVDRNYNRPVRHPYPASAEQLWRPDHLYDIVVILDHNQCPRRRYGGSAVFLHLARFDRGPTAGCIAVGEAHLRWLLERCRPGMHIRVT